ncbi:MAG: SAF domain-containing protein [Peptococcaceae bacterium]|nr:SAF domain-containing protein [Peptococcaceae bacterium]
MKKYLHIIIAVTLAVSAGVFVWVFINLNTPSVNVVITTVKMPVGTVISENHITTRLVAKSVLPAGALTNPADAVGKVLAHAVLDGDILRQEHVATGKGSLVARLIAAAPGRVAVDLPPEAAQGLTGLTMGDTVNVYGEVYVDFGGGQIGAVIQKVADKAVVISAPQAVAKEKNAIIIACDPNEEQQIAQVLSHNKKVTLFLLPGETVAGGGDVGVQDDQEPDTI